MSTVQEILNKESFYDAAIIRHGFTDYMRDYEIIVGARNGPPNTDLHVYQFIGCVEAQYQTRVAPLVFVQSLPDEYVYSGPDYPQKEDPDGFIWGVRYSTAFPGLIYVENGDKASYWSKLLKREMHEVTLETEAFHLRLIFAEVRYRFLGYEPEVVILFK
jgi:hypothetical protein